MALSPIDYDLLKSSRERALRGEIEAAMADLNGLALKDPLAAATIAELYSFRNNWRAVIENTATYLKEPVAYAGNIFDDMIALMGRAGEVTGDWKIVKECASDAKNVILLKRFPVHVLNRMSLLLSALIECAENRGHGYPVTSLNLKDSKISISNIGKPALGKLVSECVPLLNESSEAADRLFAYLHLLNLEDDARKYFALTKVNLMFSHAIFVARAFAKAGDLDTSWAVIKTHVHRWWPVDACQVAPVILVVDPTLKYVMTPERCEHVLKTIRGPGMPC